MSNIWFISDTHFGHANVIKYCDRPFSSADEMDEAIVTNWNSVVRKGDLVYHLGDVCFLKPDRARSLLDRLSGQIFLVKGNHDREQVLKACASRFVWVRDYHELTVSASRGPFLTIGDQKIVLCHFPFMTWNKSHRGSWHLHGHCHGNLPDDPGALRIDVGVDCHGFMPVSLDRVRELMSLKTFEPVDHHGAD